MCSHPAESCSSHAQRAATSCSVYITHRPNIQHRARLGGLCPWSGWWSIPRDRLAWSGLPWRSLYALVSSCASSWAYLCAGRWRKRRYLTLFEFLVGTRPLWHLSVMTE